jgi:hypothetical protein
MDPRKTILSLCLLCTGALVAQNAPFDQLGVLQANQLGGVGFDQVTAIAETNVGIYLGGRLTNTADMAFGNNVSNLIGNNADVFLCRYDFFGTLIWKKLIGYSSNTEAISGIVADPLGNIFVTGAFSNTCNFDVGGSNQSLTSAGGSDIFIAKYNPSGTLLSLTRIGGTGNEGATGICIDAGGNIGLTGTFSGTVDFNPGAGVNQLVANQPNIFVARYNTLLNHLWSISVGGDGATEYAGRITSDGQGNLFVCGGISGLTDFDTGPGVVSFPHLGQSDLFVASYRSSDGALRWAKSTGTAGTDEAKDLDVDRFGNIFVTGRFGIGTCNFNPSVFPPALLTNTSPNDDIFLVKYSNSGVFAWVKKLSGGGTNGDIATGLDVSRHQYSTTDAVVITGRYSGPIDMNPGGTPFLFNDASGGFTSGYSAVTGSMIMAYQFAPGCDPVDVLTDTFTNVFVVGSFVGTTNFAPYAGTAFQRTSFGTSDGFMTLLSYQTTPLRLSAVTEAPLDLRKYYPVDTSQRYAGAPEAPLAIRKRYPVDTAQRYAGIAVGPVAIRMYPNPAAETTLLENVPENAIIDLVALDGRLIREYQAGNLMQVQLDLSFIPDGVYLVQIISPYGQAQTQKLLVQH